MPSRRTVLASVGATFAVGSTAGCLDAFSSAQTGALQLKAISLSWTRNGRRYRNEPVQLLFDHDTKSLTGRYDPDVVGDSVRPSGDVTVSEALHEKLTRHFEVEYLLGICGDSFGAEDDSRGCRNTQTDRDDFNTVQLGDRPTITLNDHRFVVESVDSDVYTVESTDIHTFDFDAAFGERGAAPDPS